MLVDLLILLLVFGLLFMIVQRAPFDAGIKQIVLWVLLVIAVIYIINMFTGFAWRPVYSRY